MLLDLLRQLFLSSLWLRELGIVSSRVGQIIPEIGLFWYSLKCLFQKEVEKFFWRIPGPTLFRYTAERDSNSAPEIVSVAKSHRISLFINHLRSEPSHQECLRKPVMSCPTLGIQTPMLFPVFTL
jgi:hypothetical protein